MTSSSSPVVTANVMDSIVSTVQSIASTTVNAITMSTSKPISGSSSSSPPSTSTSTSTSSWSSETTTVPSSHGPSKTEGFTSPTTVGTTTEKMLSVGDLSSSLQHFGWTDYFVFVMMLVVCAVIGFYFGFIEKKGKGKGREQRRGSEALDYLVGGRKMKVFPVSLSLVASFVSGISLLGTSTEIYVYGTQYAFILITISLSAIISWYIFLPVFCNLQLTSTYEYFEMRFDRRIRLFGSILFTVGVIVWLPIAVYVPALTFNQVTGINIHVITPVVCIVCTFYTCVGGLKAVVWTDVIQSFVMFGSIFLVIIKGTMDLGGVGVVLQRNADSGRLNTPEMSLDPTVRLSILSVFVGGTLHKLQSSAVNQITIQRFISLPTIAKARQTLIIFTIGLTLLLSCCAYVGLLTFATYHDCDPLSTKLAKATDQLVPLLVMHILGIFPGLPGLFVSGVFSAALSSLSTGLNSLACVMLEDFIKPAVSKPLTERQIHFILRIIVAFFGLSCIGLVFVVEKLGMVLQLATTLGAVTQGPLLGIFFMGICMPWINGKSALTGSVVSFVVLGWTCIKAQIALATGELRFATKPVSVEGCLYDFDNSTLPTTEFTPPEKAFHHISFLWYSAFGGALTIIVACIATLYFGREDVSSLDESLFAPCIRRFMRTKKTSYSSVQLDEKLEHLKTEGWKDGADKNGWTEKNEKN